VTFVVQTFFYARLFAHLQFQGALLAEPLALCSGLLATLFFPSLAAVAYMDCSRKVVHYALAKPTKESIYTVLPNDLQYRIKPLLDTLVNRCGSLLGAGYFAGCLKLGVSPSVRRAVLLIITLGWVANALRVGQHSAVAVAEQEAARTATEGRPSGTCQVDVIPAKSLPAPSPPRMSTRWLPSSVQNLQFSIVRAELTWLLWLLLFMFSGIALGLVFELLQVG
jgi:AAA family ATP:ADP antiporter